MGTRENMRQVTEIKIGDIIWVKLEGGDNHIQNGVRPAIVVQNDKGNQHSPTIQVVPLTSRRNKSNLPTHCLIKSSETTGLKVDSIAQCEGCRLISKQDILGKIGKVTKDDMKKISRCCLINNPFLIFFSLNELSKLQNDLFQHNCFA